MRRNYKILIIEDHPRTLNKIKQICEKELHAYVDAFTTSVEAMRSYLVNDYDLIVSDINLSGDTKRLASDKSNRTLDGIETAQYLLNYKPTALIFLTAHIDIYKKEFAKSGVIMSIQKPIHEGMQLDFIFEKEIDFFDTIRNDKVRVKEYVNHRINRGLKMINVPEDVLILVKERRKRGQIREPKSHKMPLNDIFCVRKDTKGNYLKIIRKSNDEEIETNLKKNYDELFYTKEFENYKEVLVPYKSYPSAYINRHHDWSYFPDIQQLKYIGDKDELGKISKAIVEKVEDCSDISEEAKKIFSFNRET